MAGWNPWHGCTKYSEGCAHCYVYRIDGEHDRDASVPFRTKDFDLPLRRKRSGEWAIAPESDVYTCFSSDFFLDAADAWRPEAWRMMRERSDLRFIFVTKRVLRMEECLPPDWGIGYPNVRIGCTAENQRRADERLPVFLRLPAREKFVICEPLLGPIDISDYLDAGGIRQVVVGGESGPDARECRWEWVLALREQCRRTGTAFHFKQTGATFVKDGRVYHIRRRDQGDQARRAHIDLPSRVRPIE